MTIYYHGIKQEDYVPIPGYPNTLISRDGKIYNTIRHDFTNTNTRSIGRQGFIQLFDSDRVVKSYAVRTLLAAAYIPAPDGYTWPADHQKLDVVFLDDDTSNLELSNLAWAIKVDIAALLKDTAGEDQIFVVPSVKYLAISRKGRVFNIHTRHEITPVLNAANGCIQVTACVRKTRITEYHHRLMAECFVEPAEGYTLGECVRFLEVIHLDKDRANNEPSNLKWVTRRGKALLWHSTGIRALNLVHKRGDTALEKMAHSLLDLATSIGIPVHYLQRLMKSKGIYKTIIKGYLIKGPDGYLDESKTFGQKEPYYEFLWDDEIILVATLETFAGLSPGITRSIKKHGIENIDSFSYRQWHVKKR